MDIEIQWREAFAPYGLAFVESCPDYEKLDKKTQIVGALETLQLDMYNGGFIQFFCNWGYCAYLFAVEGLEQIRAFTAKEILVKSFSIIDKYQGDERIKELWDVPAVLSQQDCDELNELDRRYWKDEDRIMGKMLKCYHT